LAEFGKNKAATYITLAAAAELDT